MKFEEKVAQFKVSVQSTAQEGVRLADLSLRHQARKLDAKAKQRQFYEVEVWLAGSDGLRHEVRSVDYELHPTFQPSEVRRTDPPRFELRMRVWGSFTVRGRVTFQDGTSITLARYLSLPA